MFSLVRTAAAAAVIGAAIVAVAPASAALYFDRTAWETAVTGLGGTFADLSNLGTQVPEFSTLTAGSPITLPLGGTLSFGSDLEGRDVFTGSWATWSGGNTPAVLYAIDNATVTAAFPGGPMMAFGLEMEPDEFALHDMTLALLDDAT